MPVAATMNLFTGSASARLPRPMATGQLDLRRMLSTSDLALSPDSDCSTRNLST